MNHITLRDYDMVYMPQGNEIVKNPFESYQQLSCMMLGSFPTPKFIYPINKEGFWFSRYILGDNPNCLVNEVLKCATLSNPQSHAISLTCREDVLNSSEAFSSFRVFKYLAGLSL